MGADDAVTTTPPVPLPTFTFTVTVPATIQGAPATQDLTVTAARWAVENGDLLFYDHTGGVAAFARGQWARFQKETT